MEKSKLIKGHRYLFDYQRKSGERESFRANFLGIHHYNNHLGNYYPVIVLNKYSPNNWSNTPVNLWYMDFNLIANIQTLSDILDGKTRLPDDVLYIVDSYL
jgi:hypothetical protein